MSLRHLENMQLTWFCFLSVLLLAKEKWKFLMGFWELEEVQENQRKKERKKGHDLLYWEAYSGELIIDCAGLVLVASLSAHSLTHQLFSSAFSKFGWKLLFKLTN